MPKYLALSNSSKYIIINTPKGKIVKEFTIEYYSNPGMSSIFSKIGHAVSHVAQVVAHDVGHVAVETGHVAKKVVKSKAFKIVAGVVAAAAVTVGSTLLLNPEIGIAADAGILSAEAGGEAAVAAAGTAAAETAATTAAEVAATTTLETAGATAATTAAETAATTAAETAATTAAETASTTAAEAETAAGTTAGGGLFKKAKGFFSSHKDQIDKAKSAVQNLQQQQQQQQQVPQQQIQQALQQPDNSQIENYLNGLQIQYQTQRAQIPVQYQSQFDAQFQNWFTTNVLPIPQINSYLKLNS